MPTQCLKNYQNSPIPCRKKEKETLNLNHHLQCLHPKSIRPCTHILIDMSHSHITQYGAQIFSSKLCQKAFIISGSLHTAKWVCHSLELLCCALWNCLFVCEIKKFGVNIECRYYEFFIGHIVGQVSFVAYLDYSSAISTSKKD